MLDLKGLLSKARLPMDITRRGFLEVSTVAAAMAAMNAAPAQTGAQPYHSLHSERHPHCGPEFIGPTATRNIIPTKTTDNWAACLTACATATRWLTLM